MKIKELIELLHLLDPEMRVVVDGYENGYDEVCCARAVVVVPNPSPRNWEGEFVDCNQNGETVVLLPRKS